MMKLQPHQQRVIEEHAELAARLRNLEAFLLTPAHDSLDRKEQYRLKIQRTFMRGYASVLEERIAAFKA